jgi:iron complex outermembrane recepter protein
MKKLLILLPVLFIAQLLSAQQVIKGKIFDAVTKEPLQGASVSDSHNKVVETDGTGSFSLLTGDATVVISYTGYQSKTIEIHDNSNVAVALTPFAKGLQQVVVSASRTAQKRSEAPVAISVISKQTLEDTRATSMEQLVNKVSGVYMVNLGNEQHEMSIRQPMTTKSLFLYLEDGIPIRTTGLYNHNALLEMNMAATKQIEVIKGPASSLYGAEAIGGAVNVITQAPPALLNGRISIQANNNGYKRTDVQAGNTIGKWGLLVNGYYADRNNGPVEHSDFHKAAVTLRADHSINAKTKWSNRITWVDYYSDMLGTLDSTKFAKKDYSNPQTFTYRSVKALRYTSQLTRQWNQQSETQASVVVRHNAIGQNPSYRVRNVAGDATKANGEINESSFNTYMLLVQHEQKLNWLNSKFIAGINVDISPSDFWSNYIRINRDGRGYYVSYAATDSVLSKYSTGINNLASYLHYEISPVAGLKITTALRYDYYHYNFNNSLPPSAFTGSPSAKDDFRRLTPKIGATYNYKSVGVYANYSQGFVPPQISELYQGVSVPVLAPQIFSNYEAGGWFSLLENKLYADISIYRLDGEQEIINVLNPDGSYENKNTGKTKHTGVEYGITYRPDDQWMIRFSGANSKHTFTDYVEKGAKFSGNEMAGAPRLIANAEAMYKPVFLKGFRIGAEWQHQGSYYMDAANTKKYEGYDVLNIRTGYNARHFEIWVNWINVTQAYYSVYASKSGNTLSYNLGDPGEINVGVAYRFGK